MTHVPATPHPLRRVWVVLVAYGMTATAWAWVNPVFEAPDEPFHVGYVNRLLQEHRLPGADDAYAMAKFLDAHRDPHESVQVFNMGQGAVWFEWVHPPLYYALQALPLGLLYPTGFRGALVHARPDFWSHTERGYFQHLPSEIWHWNRELTAIRLMRMLSVLLGGFAIWMTARIASLVYPQAEQLPMLAAGLHAFIPQYTFMAATVNNDVAGYLTSAVGLWVMVRIVQGSWRPFRAAWTLGLCLGIGALSKGTTLFLWPLTLFVAWRAYHRWDERAICAGGALAVGLVMFLPAISALGGAYPDALGFLGSGHSTFATVSDIHSFLGQSSRLTVAYLGQVVGMLGTSFWGQFGWGQVPLDRTALFVYWVLAGMAIFGWCSSRTADVTVDRRALLVLGGALLIFTGSAAAIYARIYIPQGGRYLLSVGSAVVVFCALGLLKVRAAISVLLDRPVSERGLAWTLLLLMAGLNWVVLWGCIYQPYQRAWQGAG